MPRTTTITDDVRMILAQCTIAGNQLRLPPGQLDRTLYVQVDKVLKGLGGKWNRKTQAHLFTQDPTALLAGVLETGHARNLQQEAQAFYTPPDLAARMAALAQIEPGERVLEPSAGSGNLACAARCYTEDIVCIDTDVDAVQRLRNWGFRAQRQDFLTVTPAEVPHVDVVLMNPPFANGQECTHTAHALSFLAPGGRLIGIMTNAITFRKDNVYAALRMQLAGMAIITPLPPEMFKEAGTSVHTVLVEVKIPQG